MLVRFLEYSFTDEDDNYANPNFVTGVEISETYDRFVKMIDFMIKNEKTADIKGDTYYIDDYRISYEGYDDSRICINIYMIKCFDSDNKCVEV